MRRAILISCFDWYDSRLKFIKQVLELEGYLVNIYTSDFDHSKKEKIKEFNEQINYINVPKYKKNLSVRRVYSHYFFAREIYKILNKENYDLIYCLVPPNSLVKNIYRFYRKNKKAKIYFDIIDLWPESMPIDKIKDCFIVKKWRTLRNDYLKIADKIFVECEFYKKWLPRDVLSKTFVLHLASSNIYYDSRYKPDNSTISFCYLGSINSLIDIESIINIVKMAKLYKTVILNIIGGGEKTEEFLKLAKEAGATVNYYGLTYDYKTKSEVLNSSHFGLNLYNSQSIGLTIKSIDYFSAGLPIINNIKGDTWMLVKKYNLGINIDNNMTSDIFDTYIYDRNKIYSFFQNNFTPESLKRVLLDKIDV